MININLLLKQKYVLFYIPHVLAVRRHLPPEKSGVSKINWNPVHNDLSFSLLSRNSRTSRDDVCPKLSLSGILHLAYAMAYPTFCLHPSNQLFIRIFYSLFFLFSTLFSFKSQRYFLVNIFFLVVFHLSLFPGPPRLAMLPAGQVIPYLFNCTSIKINFNFKDYRFYSLEEKSIRNTVPACRKSC